MDLVKIASRVAAMGSMMVSNAPDGPWQPSDPQMCSAEIEKRFSAGHMNTDPDTGYPDEADIAAAGYADPTNGVILFIQKNGRSYAVSDVSVIHGGDAVTKYDLMGVDEEGAGNSDAEGGSFDDPLPVLDGL